METPRRRSALRRGGAGQGSGADAGLCGPSAGAAGSCERPGPAEQEAASSGEAAVNDIPSVGHEQLSSALDENTIRLNRVRVGNVPTVVPIIFQTSARFRELVQRGRAFPSYFLVHRPPPDPETPPEETRRGRTKGKGTGRGQLA
eukprot:8854720-Pyramimonas_sp.AAC.1